MANLFKKMSLVPKGLRYKTMIAFSLMSLIPLLICVWLTTTYIFPNIDLFLGLSLGNISLILVICVIISLLGLYVAKEMIDPVIKMAEEAKKIAEGDTSKVIELSREDEIGDLSASLNIMNQKIKDNIEELRLYGERTKLINIEINKKVLTLSTLLQIGNLISSSAKIETILDFISGKISDIEEGLVTFIMLEDADSKELNVVSSCKLDKEKLESLKMKKSQFPLQPIVVDQNTPDEKGILDKVFPALGLKNVALFPIVFAGKKWGVLVVGNNKDGFVFKEDEKELLKIFIKQISIAVENDLLIIQAKELAVKDELTGLYNQSYLHSRLDEEIKRAVMYQRPCGYLLIDLDGFKDFHDKFGDKSTEYLLKSLAKVLKEGVTDVDKVARLTVDTFAIVLPERNKRQSANIAEELRKKVEDNLGNIMGIDQKLTISIGISENPIDGMTSDELMDKAEKLLKSAKSLGKNRVVV